MDPAAPLRRRRIPVFHPVPVAPRHDGWTPERQAAFVGYLAQTRSVLAACRLVGMSRASAYALRRRPGAAGFAAAWDAALGVPHAAVDPARAKLTGQGAGYRFRVGLAKVVMRRGRYVATYWKADDNALLQLLAQLDRGGAGEGAGSAVGGGLNPHPASTSRAGNVSP